MIQFFIQGFIIGILFGVPAGAIGALTLQRSLSNGFAAGFITGLGSTAADIIYALVGLFGITMIEQLILRWQIPISIAGGSVIVIMGISIFLKEVEIGKEEVSFKKYSAMFLSSFFIAILNTATILSFIAIFAVVKIESGMAVSNQIGFISGIALGTCIWWAALSVIAVKIKKIMIKNVYEKIYQIMGVLLVLIGIAVIVHGII